jgi:site-specific DNA-methyltransferase (adenine-specific)
MTSNVLHSGDCLKMLLLQPDHSVDLVLVDPPHGRTNCSWDVPIPFEPLWKQYKRVLKPHGVVLMMTTQPFTSHATISNLDWFRYELIWEKSKASGWLNAKRRPMAAHETILVFGAKAPRYFPQMRSGDPYDKGLTKAQSQDDLYNTYGQVVVKSEDGSRYPRSVLYFKTAESEGKVYHKTQKPVALLEYLIQTYSLPGETVLDNAMGSGSTGVAALRTGRNFVGIEQDPEIWQIAKQRTLDTQKELYERDHLAHAAAD